MARPGKWLSLVQAVALPAEPVMAKDNDQITFLFFFNMVQGSRE
jgi:hypothetical protein